MFTISAFRSKFIFSLGDVYWCFGGETQLNVANRISSDRVELMSGALQQCNKTFFHAQPFRSVNVELAVIVCAVFFSMYQVYKQYWLMHCEMISN